MTLLEEHKKAFSDKPKAIDTLRLIASLESMYHELDSETQDRITRYRLYNNFFSGLQWGRKNRKEGRHKYTVNMCEPIVMKYSSLLVGDAPTISIPRTSDVDVQYDVTGFEGLEDQVPDFSSDENRSEILEKILKRITYKDNPGAKIFY